MRPSCSLTRRSAIVIALGLAFIAAPLSAQRGAIPPIRQIGAVIGRAKDSIGIVAQLVPLGDGRIMINDVLRKTLFTLDSTLSNPVVVADTTSGTNKAYGGRGGTALFYRADTVLFVDVASTSFLVITPEGKIQRVIAFPRPASVNAFSSLGSVSAGIDPKGGLIYRPFGGTRCGDPGTQDSAEIVRTDIVSRVTDTLGFVHYDKCPNRGMGQDAKGNPVPPTPVIRPFPKADSWQLLSDGTVAFVRAQDFTIDWIDPDGTHRTTPRIPHDWQHLADSNKIALVDSLKAYYEAHPMHSSGFMGGSDGIAHPYSLDVMPELPDPASLPDYLPAFTGGLKADNDANLWVPEAPARSIVPPPPGAVTPPRPMVYDVINRLGVLIDRVEIPGGTAIAGFGPGVAYLQSREGNSTALVRVRLR